MSYTIGNLSKILGVSVSTIRRFEKRGLGKINRNENNQYRYYTLCDIIRLSIYVSMYRQGAAHPKRSVRISEDVESEIINTEERIIECERRIEEMKAAKRCWKDHIQLLQYQQALQGHGTTELVIEYPALMIDPIRNLEDMAENSLFFKLLREKNEMVNYFRLCNLWKLEDVNNYTPTHMQAFCVPQNDLFKKQNLGRHFIELPKRKYFVIYEETAGLIDDEAKDKAEKINKIYERIHQVLKNHHTTLAGDVIALTISITPPVSSLIMIPYIEDC